MINVTNGKILRLLVDDEPFDLRYGTLEQPRAHARPARGRAAPRGALALARRPGRHRAHDAARLVRPARRSRRSCTRSSRTTARRGSSCSPSSSPTSRCRSRARTRAPRPRCASRCAARRTGAAACARASCTARGRRACASPPGWTTSSRDPRAPSPRASARSDLARVTVSTSLEPGETLRIVKFIAYGWSSRRSLPALRDQVDAALAAAARTGWDGLLAVAARVPRRLLGARRRRARRRPGAAAGRALRALRGPAVRRARRGPRDPREGADRQRLRRPLVLGHGDVHAAGADVRRAASAARDALHLAPLDARSRAGARAGAEPRRARRSRGARSPATSARATGRRARRRCTSTPTSPTRRGATSRQPRTRRSSATSRSSCSSRRRGCGARYGHHDATGGFRIDGVTGPDEYSALADNNVYTNIMAARNLRAAVGDRDAPPQARAGARRRRGGDRGVARRRAGDRHPVRRRAARHAAVGGLHAPSPVGLRGHAGLRSTRCSCTTPTRCCTRARSSSRPISSSRCTWAATPSAPSSARATSTTTRRITVRDSSLSACIQAIVAAEVGHTELAYDYLDETAFIDLRDLAHNTRDGIHLAGAGRLLARRGRRASAGCATTARRSSSRPRLPAQLEAPELPAHLSAGGGCA